MYRKISKSRRKSTGGRLRSLVNSKPYEKKRIGTAVVLGPRRTQLLKGSRRRILVSDCQVNTFNSEGVFLGRMEIVSILESRDSKKHIGRGILTQGTSVLVKEGENTMRVTITNRVGRDAAIFGVIEPPK